MAKQPVKNKNPFAGNWFLTAGAAITVFMILFTLLGQIWTPYDPSLPDENAMSLAPSPAHWFGTDSFGRDILSRVMNGAGTTLLIAFLVVLIGGIAGVIIGSLTGYFGGVVDEVLMRICDLITAFPSILLALIILRIVEPGVKNVVWVLAILFVPSFARVVRTEFARCRTQNYVKLARLQGAGPFRIMLRHILPNVWPVLLPAVSIGFNNAVLAEASMSFLGVGVSASEVSLGRMLYDSQNTILRGAPWYALTVGLVIVLMILGFSLLGEGLRQRNR